MITGAKTIPQIIANSVNEFKTLADAIMQKGFTEIDFNMGCPFPMQVSRHRGAGLLSDVQTVKSIMDEIARFTAKNSIKFSVKMRLGQNSPDEAFALLPILNATPLAHITLHPRLGKQQYKEAIDFASFVRFYDECRHPLVYNGDITSVSQMRKMEAGYPKLAGIMIGRGMLARPSLAAEYKAASEANAAGISEKDLLRKILEMHSRLYEHARSTYQGDSQILSHVKSFWEYLEPSIPKKAFKKIKTAGNFFAVMWTMQSTAGTYPVQRHLKEVIMIYSTLAGEKVQRSLVEAFARARFSSGAASGGKYGSADIFHLVFLET